MTAMEGRPFQGTIGRYFDESQPAWELDPLPPPGAPNIVLCVLDDVGFAQLGCYGSDIATPTFDRLAAGGLQFTNFHTTAVCSATRACLLTGRNHHSNGMGRVIEVATGFPGYDARIPRRNGFLSEVLVEAGYATFAVGKWHLTPDDQCHAGASRARWPLGRGFQRFYGFMNGETHQYVPALIEDNHPINAVDRLRPDYHLTEDLADQAIACIRDLKVVDPAKPFFLYFAPGACHAPHQVPEDWWRPYGGRFAEGWDAARPRILERQVALGVMAPGTRLARRPSWVPAWDSLARAQQTLYQRYMEVFAGFLTHTDHQVGRLCRFLEDIGQLEQTLIMVLSDNGASSEGGPGGSTNAGWNRPAAEPVEDILARADEIAGPRCHSNYPWGWTMAGNTPFGRWKREVHEGGVADPLIVHWPERLADGGAKRRQYLHAIDLMPTVLELVGIEPPQRIGGVTQAPLEGMSLAEAWLDGGSARQRTTQYYEMFGNRALYHDGWKAVTAHPYMTTDQSFDDDRWELYHVAVDPSECDDLAEARPDKLRQLIDRWWVEAGRYQVLPLDNRPLSDFVLDRVSSVPPRASYVYLPGAAAVPEAVAVNVKNRSHEIEAEVEVPEGMVPEGVLLSQGSFLGGWCLYVQGGRLTYAHNLGGQELVHLRGDREVPARARRLGFAFRRDGEHRGVGVLLIDGEAVGGGRIERFTPVRFSATGAGVTCGYSGGLAVTDEFVAPFPFTGRLRRVTVTVDGPPHVDPEGEARLAIASQ